MTVTVSTGDGGVTGTIGSPATDPNVISAGASTDNRLYEQTGYAWRALLQRHVGQRQHLRAVLGRHHAARPDRRTSPRRVRRDWAVCEPGFANCINFHNAPQPTDIQAFGGTSQSAPMTAGAAALVISAYRSTHAGASPTPAVVKQIITGTAQDMGLPADEQGSGLLDARAAVEAALTWPGATGAPAGVDVAHRTSTNQVQLTGNPGTTHSASVNGDQRRRPPLTVRTGARTF